MLPDGFAPGRSGRDALDVEADDLAEVVDTELEERAQPLLVIQGGRADLQFMAFAGSMVTGSGLIVCTLQHSTDGCAGASGAFTTETSAAARAYCGLAPLPSDGVRQLHNRNVCRSRQSVECT